MLFFSSILVLLILEISATPNARIIGGKNATVGDFPFAAAIQVQTAYNKFFCGGSLVLSRWVITSGHCVYNATLFTVQLGSIFRTKEDSNRISLRSYEYIVHPNFKPDSFQNDIGLIKLRMNVTETDYVKNGYIYFYEISDSFPLVSIGWGQTSDSDLGYSEYLHYVYVYSLSNEECKLVYGDQISDSMVCAEGSYNEGPCLGDSGGPLLISGENDVMHIIGIASFISSDGCENNQPSGFIKLVTYQDWLNNIFFPKNEI